MRFFNNGVLEYGKTVRVIFRMEGDGIIGDGMDMLDPGDELYGLTYDQVFKELSENGSFEVPLNIPEYTPNVGTLMVHYSSKEDYENAAKRGEVGDDGRFVPQAMTRDQINQISVAYTDKFNVPLNGPPLDFGVWRMDIDQLCEYALAAIATSKPINWREILGPTMHEINPMLVS